MSSDLNELIIFDSDQWVYEKRLELARLIFKQCLGIDDFTIPYENKTQRIKYDFVQSPQFSRQLDQFKPCLNLLFGSVNIRSLMNCNSLSKRNSINIIKQLLKFFGYKLSSQSEYQCLLENKKKKYDTYYVVEKIIGDENGTDCEPKIKVKVKVKVLTNE